MSKIQCRDILNSMFDGLYVLDRQRRIQLWNAAAESITGFAAHEVIGQPCSAGILNHTDEHGNSLCKGRCPAVATLDRSERVEEELFLKHRNGHRVGVLVRMAPLLDAAGNVVGAIETFSPSVVSQRKTQEVEALKRDALCDALTGLPNRRYIDRMLELALEEARRYKRQFGVLLIDADDFKEVNDTHGHAVGDEVLKMIAKTMQHACRASDMLARYGGEEFICIARDVDDPQQVHEVGERMRGLVGASVRSSQHYVVEVTVSVGATMAQETDSIQSLCRRADKALYQAKRLGKNRVVLQ